MFERNVYLLFLFVVIYSNIYLVEGLASCCLMTRSKPCRRNCGKLVADHKHKFRFSYVGRRLNNIVKTCPRSETFFWKCLVDSDVWRDFRANALEKSSKYGFCCREAKHLSCEIQCLTSKKSSLLNSDNCNSMREGEMVQCINRVDAAESCCSSRNGNCVRTCQKYFKSSSSVSIYLPLRELEKDCGKDSFTYKCAITQTDINSLIHDYRACCTLGKTYSCERRCRQVLSHPSGYEDMFKKLSNQCGSFSPSDDMYKCLLKRSSYKIERPKITTPLRDEQKKIEDSTNGKKIQLQCCHQAVSQECQKWCSKILARPNLMTLWDTMYLSCIQNPDEVELSNCMSDILEPCELSGNTELKFCANLNNRPLESFRRFNDFGDSSAQKFLQLWADGGVKLTRNKLIFKDVNTCEPEMFKTLACLISVKPCDHRRLQRQVCRSDCEELLSKCLVDSEVYSFENVKKICAVILPNQNQTNCISVRDYLHKPTTEAAITGVTIPCSGQPCQDDEICEITRKCSPNSVDCKPYRCVKGCLVSPQSRLAIAVGQYAKLPVKENGKDCYEACMCQSLTPKEHSPYFGGCKKFGCKYSSNCTINRKIYSDGEVFEEECNTCVCNDGNKVCTEKDCGKTLRTSNNIRPRRHYDYIDSDDEKSCDCRRDYEPVCSKSGQTFVNPCHAKCCQTDDRHLGMGDCQKNDPCNPNPCRDTLKCFPKRHVCLSQWVECPQYTCGLHGKPENDTYGLSDQILDDEVCGFDGVTYKNSDALERAGTGIDYVGPCLPIEFQNMEVKPDRCKKIKCEAVENVHCNLIKLPGACCPVCGSSLRILYSQRDMIRHRNFVNFEPFSVKDIVFHLRRLLTVLECRLYAHVLIPGELIVGVLTDSKNPSRDQFLACQTEALKIHGYINDKSPIIRTNYYLSILKASQLRQKDWNNKSSALAVVAPRRSLLIFSFLIFYYLTL